jgi:pimeloyl-ACP methyl ester carboxylesterase
MDSAALVWGLVRARPWVSLSAVVGAGVVVHRILFSYLKGLRSPDGAMVSCTDEADGAMQHVLLTGPQPSSSVRVDSVASSREAQDDSASRPVVVIIHGFGCNSLEWGTVQTALAKTHTVMSYDRVLYATGRSLKQPRSARVLVAELEELLDKAVPNPSTPLVLIGHSYGGLLAQVFAMRHAGRVAGLVLIDPAHEKQWHSLPRDFVLAFRSTPIIFSLFRACAPLGMARYFNWLGLMNFPPLFLYDPEARKKAAELYSQSHIWRRVADELSGCNVAFEQMPEDRVRYELPPGLPIRLIIAGHRKYSPTLNPDGVTRAFLSLHADLLQRPNCHLIMANDSDHWIHLQQPNLVIDAAADLLSLAGEQPRRATDSDAQHELSPTPDLP